MDKSRNFNTKKFLIYTGNHDLIGSKDYFDQLQLHLGNNYELIFDKNLNQNYDGIIVLENCARVEEHIKLLLFLKKFKGKKIFIFTEFITSYSSGSKKVLLFNNFKKLNKISSFFLECDTIFQIIILVFFFTLRLLNNILTKVLSFFRFKTGLIKKIKILKKYNEFIAEFYEFIHFYIRIELVKHFTNKFDLILKSHEKIYPELLGFDKKKIYEFPFLIPNEPEFDFDKEFFLDFSGVLTNYRLKILSNLKLNDDIFKKTKILQNIDNYLGKFIVSNKKNDVQIFSLHLEKHDQWKFSSPTRYLNSLKKNEIPIIFKHFDDKYSNLLAINISVLETKTKNEIKNILEKFKLKVAKFNKNNREELLNLISEI